MRDRVKLATALAISGKEETIRMKPRPSMAIPIALVGMLLTVTPAAGQGSTASASIRAGTCEEPGESVHVLADVPRPVEGAALLTSVSSLPLSITDLLTSQHNITIDTGPGGAILCGDISPADLGDGEVPVRLETQDGSDGLATAWFSDDDAGVTIVRLAVIGPPSTGEGDAAATIGGVHFPDGERSFVDRVVDYAPPSDHPAEPYRDPTTALGVPDFRRGDPTTIVALGQGGSVTLRFSDNSLTGSGDAEADLWIFEAGGQVEDTFVEVSVNGRDWVFVGEVTGATSGIDVDAFGIGPESSFSFVRLTDDPTDGPAGMSGGADIDAVGAIASGLPVDDPTAGVADVASISPFTGVWVTDRRQPVLLFVSDGRISGTYDESNTGRFMLFPTGDGRTLEGYWFEDFSNQRCPVPLEGRDYWGRTVFKFDEDLTSYTAERSFCDADPTGQETYSATRGVAATQ
jgi:hypothetical protein